MIKVSCRWIDRAVESALFAIFLAFTIVGGLQVFNRFVLGLPLSWSEEFQKFGHIWMVFLAIPVAYRRGAHLGMDALLRLLPVAAQRGIGFAIELMWLALAASIGWFTLAIMQVARMQDSPGLGLRMDHVYAGMVVGSVYLGIVALRRIAAHLRWIEPDAPASEGGA
ncbi:MAG: TRAP transporter small permease [Alphaproteobacteria bacterium]|nr:TRAP transporter small permease [Alphaproteobacteria bacterium]